MATLAIVVVAIIVAALRIEGEPDRRTPFTPADPGADLVVDLPSADTLAMWYELGHRVGPEDAPIRIIEWGSYLCKFCLEFAAAIDSVQQRFPGMISVAWLHYLPPRADLKGIDAFMAHSTECVGDQIPFEALYKAALLEGRSIDNRARLFAAVSDLGVEDERLLGACVDSWTHRDRLPRFARLGEAAKVTGTPTWYLNETRYDGAVSAATLQQAALARLRR
ncbi:MAG: thioredoxin domain-containing protein [Gemmatimonadales bacterium]|nr:thioredoxin domain-containing protein [Gemmatimonadales bacterium]MDZ4391138.1 thioredoxin domain-containing protein [Gemmatimonadales bacterium]